MDNQTLDFLENKIEALLARYIDLQNDNRTLREENVRLREEKASARNRIDDILRKLGEMQGL